MCNKGFLFDTQLGQKYFSLLYDILISFENRVASCSGDNNIRRPGREADSLLPGCNYLSILHF
jgi:hypothetical protein